MSESYDILFTSDVEQDIENVHSYSIENGSLDAADRLIELLYDRVDALERFPHRGSVPRELGPSGFTDFRQIVACMYRLIYRVSGRQVIVTLIINGRREVAPISAERLLRNRD